MTACHPCSCCWLVCCVHILLLLDFQEQKAREAAVKAMQEKAAQEYREEAARVAAEASCAKAAAQAQAAARAKARMKPRSSIPPSSTTFSAQNPSAASGEAAAGGKFSFGGVRGVGKHFFMRSVAVQQFATR